MSKFAPKFAGKKQLGTNIGDTYGAYQVFPKGKASYTENLHQCVGVVLEGQSFYALCHCLRYHDEDCLEKALEELEIQGENIKDLTVKIHTIEFNDSPKKYTKAWSACDTYYYIEDVLLGKEIPIENISKIMVPYEEEVGQRLSVDKQGNSYRGEVVVKQQSQGCTIL